MIPEHIRLDISDNLSRIESEHQVRVLYACESGSRAWGFASTDSDYDVRFLYVHRRNWYLSIEDHRDVIERPIRDELDISGWEMRKALRLMRKSNPPLFEWLKSPEVYRADWDFLTDFRALAHDYYSPYRCFRHYLHMAEGNFRDYLKGDMAWLKKYLYVLRPMLACRRIERSTREVPMVFSELVEAVVEESEVLAAIERLLARKRAGAELDRAPRDEVLSSFIESELPRLAGLAMDAGSAPDPEGLNAFFRRICIEANED